MSVRSLPKMSADSLTAGEPVYLVWVGGKLIACSNRAVMRRLHWERRLSESQQLADDPRAVVP